MNQRRTTHRLRLLGICAALALAATACAGGGQSGEASNAAEAAAATNEAQLQRTDGLLTTQFLDTADGSIADLSEVITGDRPVLLWYWAPL